MKFQTIAISVFSAAMFTEASAQAPSRRVGTLSRDRPRPAPVAGGGGYGAIPTPSPAQPNMAAGCTSFRKVEEGESCNDFVQQSNGQFDFAKFFSWNPSVGTDCDPEKMPVGNYVCINGPTPLGNPTVATPTPIQPGMITYCNKFFFVDRGVRCNDIVKSQNITSELLYQLNPTIGEKCENLWTLSNVCVGYIGASKR